MRVWRSPLGVRTGLILGMLLVLVTAQVATAHESREVGEYEFVVGFLNEPAILEEPNGLSLSVTRLGDGEPVEGLAGSLEAEVVFGDQSRELELNPAFGQPGAYQSDFIPTAAGAYTFHITGTIEGTQIDESFTSGPDTFSEVEDRGTMSFPNAVPPIGSVATDAEDAADAADTAQTLAIVGLLAGLIGIGIGAAAIVLSRRRPATQDASRTASEAAD